MFRRGLVLSAALLGLAGCGEGGGGLFAGLSRLGAPADVTSEGIRTLSLLGGDARVRAPEGYCIDQGASNARTGFAVMAGCALLTDAAVVMPSMDGLITVQFGEEATASVSGNEEAFAEFLSSEVGRTILASDGAADSIEGLTVEQDGVGVLARFEDSSGPAFPKTSGPQWRGFLDIGGRMVTVSVLSFERAPLSSAQGERVLTLVMTELDRVNAAEATPEPATSE